MTNLQQLTQLNKKFSKSFNQQKSLLKKLLMGKTQYCAVCQQPLHFTSDNTSKAQVSCQQGCTDIELEL